MRHRINQRLAAAAVAVTAAVVGAFVNPVPAHASTHCAASKFSTWVQASCWRDTAMDRRAYFRVKGTCKNGQSPYQTITVYGSWVYTATDVRYSTADCPYYYSATFADFELDWV